MTVSRGWFLALGVGAVITGGAGIFFSLDGWAFGKSHENPSSVLASTNFDDGQSGPFTTSNGSTKGNVDIVILDDPTGQFSGKVAQFEFSRPSVSQSADVNRALRFVAKRGIGLGETVFIRGRVLIPTPALDMIDAQRKLIYVQRQPNDASFGFLKIEKQKLKAEITGNRVFSMGSFPFDRKVTIEMQITANSSPGLADGVFRIWTDGKLVLDANNIMWLTSEAPFTVFRFGQQAQHLRNDKSILFKEFRYWDDLTIATERIGL